MRAARGTPRAGQFARLFIIGDPVLHSLSPEMQAGALARSGLRGAYVPIHARPRDLANAVRALETLGFLGGNITIPHKEKVLPLLVRVSERAAAIGAANCLARGRGGFVGDNTDGLGFRDAVEARGGARLRGCRVLLVGAGGAARAVLHAAVEAGAAEVLIVNRTMGRARALARDAAAWGSARIAAAPFSDLAALAAARRGGGARERFDIVINATSLGLAPTDRSPLPVGVLRCARVACDLVYARRETRFVHDARANGLRTIDGIDILAAQGVRSFESWFGRAPTRQFMVREARAAWTRRQSHSE
ncbi:MAG: shikimate dehydrogenase [bacterium]